MDRIDTELLTAFVTQRDEAAFTELVNGRIHFVYAAALAVSQRVRAAQLSIVRGGDKSEAVAVAS